ncbi:hypothetical protein BDW71DRAFT_208465 [Aspergillus fruticulosus]
MATPFEAHVHRPFEAPSDLLFNARRVPGIPGNGMHSTVSEQASRKPSSEGGIALASLVQSLGHRNSGEMNSSKIIGADYEAILEWIRLERMRKLPPEGSSYDKVLVWARLFVERLHTLDSAIQDFEGDSHMAAELAYIHCASLLELGDENSSALLDVFGFFHRCSTGLENLLHRTELFAVSQSIKDQLILALADLVTLVVGVATHCHRSLGSLASESISIDIYSTFTASIASFRARCEDVSDMMWRHQLLGAGLHEDKVTQVKTIKNWLGVEDPVLGNIAEFTAHFAQEREESTCLWMAPYLTRFLKSNQKTLFISGKPGSGKPILATVINDHLQYPIGGAMYKSIFVPINARVPASTTPRAAAKSILSQLFAARIGNVQLYEVLSDAYNRCHKSTPDEQHDNILWDTVGLALRASMKGAKELVLVVDGADEASGGQTALVHRLRDASQTASNLKLIILGTQKHETSNTQTAVQITPELILDDIVEVVRKIFQSCSTFAQLSEEQREITVTKIAEAANGSFLWAKLAAKRIRHEHPPNRQAFVKTVNALAKADLSITDFVVQRLDAKVSNVTKRILVWLATAARPLTLRELSALLSVRVDKGTISDPEEDPLTLLRPVVALVFCQNNTVSLRHGQIRAAIIDTVNKGKLITALGDRHVDLARRLLLYVKLNLTDEYELSDTPLTSQRKSKLLERFPLLDFALRYWIAHGKAAFGSGTDQEVRAMGKELGPYLPTKSVVPLLEMTETLTVDHPATQQEIICQALFYREIRDIVPLEASDIFYHAAITCQKALSSHHVITRRLAQDFLETTVNQVTESRTEVMIRRTEMLQLLVESYKVQYGQNSKIVISTSTQLVEHFNYIKEEHKAQQLATSPQTSQTEATASESTTSHQTDESLLVQLHGRKPSSVQEGTYFASDDIEADELLSQTTSLQSFLYSEIESEVQSMKQEISWSETTTTTAESSFQEIISSTSNATSTSITAAQELVEIGRSAKTEDVSLRLYHSIRQGRPIGDELRERATADLLHFYERKSQTDKLLRVHQDILDDLTKEFRDSHPAVLKELRVLADLTRPRSASVGYHRQIVQVLNKKSDFCHPDAFESLLIVATELLDQGQYSEAQESWRTLFNTLRQPNINPKLQDQGFVKSVYERYMQCLRMMYAELHMIHDVAVQYRNICQTRFGASAFITIQSTNRLLEICRESNRYEAEAIALCKQLLQVESVEADIDHEELQAILDAHYEEQYASIASASVESVSSEQIQQVITTRKDRLSTVRSTFGWAHENALSEMKSMVSLYSKRGETQAAVLMLQETALQIVSKETSAAKLAAAAESVASSYIAIGQIQRAKELSDELYRRIVLKETGYSNFDLPARGSQSLVFMAQFEYALREGKERSLTVSEIHSSLCAEFVYFERYRSEARSKSSTLEKRKEKLQVSFSQAKVFIGTLLEYFSMYAPKNFLRSVAIASHLRVAQLLATRDYQTACDLAATAFKYIQSQNGLSSSTSVIKILFNLSLAISGQDLDARPGSSTRKQMLSTSAPIMSATLGHCKQANIDLTRLDLVTLNKLIKLLDAQRDYTNLAWILTGLWNNRDRHPPTQQEATYTLALGRMLVITRYLMGEYMAAIRLAEDIVYNSAKVHGRQHPSTEEMTVLLSQMYTSVAQGYQGQKERRELAYRYYKKAAALHVNALRAFIDPTSLASPAIDEGGSTPSSGSGSSSPGTGAGGERPEDSGKYVRQHLHLLKLAVERLGNWPKDYTEYERLNSALFQVFADDLKGVDGVDKWDLKNFGSGRAEASDDLISPQSHPVFSLGERFAIAV